MKKALIKDSLKEIKNTYKRFISILLMAFLGVGFFAGIRAASPDMIYTLDKRFDENNVYDIEVISTLGLTDEDIKALKEIDKIENVYGEYSEDVLLNYEDTEIVTKVLSLDSVNTVTLLEGRMPQNANECLVEEAFCKFKNKNIGDSLTIETEEDSIIKEKEVTIVGTMESPLYISRERDTSKLGSGKVSYNLYLPKESFESKVYTQVYITLKNASKMETSSQEYKNYIQEAKDEVEKIKEQRQNARYEEVRKEAEEKLQEAEEKLEEEKQTAEEKLADAENKITSGESKLISAQNTLNNKKAEAESKFQSAEKQLEEAKNEIAIQEQNMPKQIEEANKQIENLNAQKEDMQNNLNTLNTNISTLEKQYQNVLESLKNTNLTQEQITNLQMQKASLEEAIENLNVNKKQVETGIKQIENGISTINTRLQEGKEKLKQAKEEIAKQEETLSASREQANAEFKTAQQKINTSKKELEEGKEELNKNRNEYNDKIKEAEKKLSDAREEIDKIDHPTWYILDRESNTGYSNYVQDSKSIENLGKVFPIVFFVIATLISLTSMTRMVEEQRVQIGTLKALGYNKMQIAMKYLLYAGIACIVGGILGMLVGFQLLPRIILMMYNMMYSLPDLVIKFNWYYAILGLGLASICIIGATLYTVLSSLGETPSELMRPKAPKPGKRVLLEKIPFIWKHLKFNQKVTVRNIFRYKKRFLMTIIGIAGCTALILTGFGIKDAISAIIPSQYQKIYHYDMQISLKNSAENESVQEFIQELEKKEEVSKVVETYMTSGTLVNGEKEEDIQIIVPKDEKIENVIQLIDTNKKEKIQLEEGKIAITDKVAQLLNVKQGDKITLKDNDNNQKEFEISNIVENYIYHYVYMPKGLYEETYGEYKTNVLYVQNSVKDEEQEKEMAKELLKDENVNAVALNSNMESLMKDMMNSLNYVVVILIISAGLLAFVVLYNLSNVNISERIRELATIKVLGFYDKEVYDYVTRETVLLTVIGIILGLFGGYLLNMFIIKTCEINVIRFGKEIMPISYLYAIIITVVFTLIVNVVTYFSLKKIDMIESLKSIE